MIYVTTYNSPLGIITLACQNDKLIGLWLEGQKYFENQIKNEKTCEKETEILNKTKKWLDIYFDGKDPGFNIDVEVGGSLFQKIVCEIMMEIPFGQLMTYKQISDEVCHRLNKEKMSAQAVGHAVGHNPISIIIPCHRVIGTNGSLTGYAGGIQKKVYLLKNEHVDFNLNHLTIPIKGTAI